MSATEHLQPKQLAMFMPAGRILNEYNLADAFTLSGKDLDENARQSHKIKNALVIQKRQENQGSHRRRAAERGVQEPIDVWEGTQVPHVMDGHHRLVGAYDRNPTTEVPLRHHDERSAW